MTNQEKIDILIRDGDLLKLDLNQDESYIDKYLEEHTYLNNNVYKCFQIYEYPFLYTISKKFYDKIEEISIEYMELCTTSRFEKFKNKFELKLKYSSPAKDAKIDIINKLLVAENNLLEVLFDGGGIFTADPLIFAKINWLFEMSKREFDFLFWVKFQVNHSKPYLSFEILMIDYFKDYFDSEELELSYKIYECIKKITFLQDAIQGLTDISKINNETNKNLPETHKILNEKNPYDLDTPGICLLYYYLYAKKCKHDDKPINKDNAKEIADKWGIESKTGPRHLVQTYDKVESATYRRQHAKTRSIGYSTVINRYHKILAILKKQDNEAFLNAYTDYNYIVLNDHRIEF